MRELTRQMLQRAGYRAIAVGTASKALEMARQPDGPLDLLLTDMVLQEMTGDDLAQYIHHLAPSIRVLFMSGYTNQTPVSGNTGGPLNLLQKPFSGDQLLRKVRSALER